MMMRMTCGDAVMRCAWSVSIVVGIHRGTVMRRDGDGHPTRRRGVGTRASGSQSNSQSVARARARGCWRFGGCMGYVIGVCGGGGVGGGVAWMYARRRRRRRKRRRSVASRNSVSAWVVLGWRGGIGEGVTRRDEG